MIYIIVFCYRSDWKEWKKKELCLFFGFINLTWSSVPTHNHEKQATEITEMDFLNSKNFQSTLIIVFCYKP